MPKRPKVREVRGSRGEGCGVRILKHPRGRSWDLALPLRPWQTGGAGDRRSPRVVHKDAVGRGGPGWAGWGLQQQPRPPPPESNESHTRFGSARRMTTREKSSSRVQLELKVPQRRGPG